MSATASNPGRPLDAAVPTPPPPFPVEAGDLGATTTAELAAAYRLIAECLVAPDFRDEARVADLMASLAAAPAAIRDPVAAFLANPRSRDADEHLLVLELTPPCPLYVGHYIFDEPHSCRGAGLSGRNGYMIEVAAVYRHFGFQLGGGELADYLPAMSEFLAISLELRDRDPIGIRRRFVEAYLKPGLEPMRAALAKYDSPYGLLIEALAAAVAADTGLHAGQPIWKPPVRTGAPRVAPAVTAAGRRIMPANERVTQP